MCCYKGEINLKAVDTDVGHYYESDFEPVHTVKINKDSNLFDILESEEIAVNSFHKICVWQNGTYEISVVSNERF